MNTLNSRIALCALLFGAAAPVDLGAQWSTDSVTIGRQQIAAVTAGGKAYFAGGRRGTSMTSRIDIHDLASGAWSTGELTLARTGVAAAAVGNWVLFTGGATTLNTSTARIDVLDTGTGIWSTAELPSGPRFNAAVAVIGTKAFFAGGSTGGALNLIPSKVVDIYDSALGAPNVLGAWSTAMLSQARSAVAGTAVGDQALFAGGVIGSVMGVGPDVVDTVDIYDVSTGLWTTAALSVGRVVGADAATTAGTRAYFGGGELTATVTDVVDIYDEPSGSWSTLTLSEARAGLSAIAQGDTVLFAGGLSAGVVSDVIDVLDAPSGTWGPVRQLSAPRGDMGSTTLGGQALFVGGAEAGFAGSTVVDIQDSTWTDLGGSTSGITGKPLLNGTGSLVGGTPASMALTNAPTGAAMLAWISFGPTPFAALGGTVHAFPYTSQLGFTADGAGSFSGTTGWPVGIPAATDVWFQFLVQDGSSIHGITLSNGVRATTP